VNASENAGVAGEHRPGGGFMPYLVPTDTDPGRLRTVHTKEGRERRHEFTAIRDRQRQAPSAQET
jgi:hypothetical protein